MVPTRIRDVLTRNTSCRSIFKYIFFILMIKGAILSSSDGDYKENII